METKLFEGLCLANKTNKERCTNYYPNYIYKIQSFCLEKDKTYWHPLMRYDSIVMIVEGKFKLTINNKTVEIEKNEMIVFPIFGSICLETTEKTVLLSLSYNYNGNHPCLIRALNGTTIEDLNNLSDDLYKLQFTPAFECFVKLTKKETDYLQGCQAIYRDKIFEFGLLLVMDYQKEDILHFMKPFIRKDISFIDGLNAGLDTFSTVADICDWLSMSEADFREKFAAVMNQDPEEWLHKMKMQMVFAYVLSYVCTPSQLASKFGFISVDHLDYFCKKNYSLSVTEFIEKYKNYPKITLQ